MSALQGPLGPSTCTDDAAVGTQAWVNPTNAAAEDGSFATCAMTPVNTPTHYLKALGFGFSIPTGTTIEGIVLEWKRKTSTGNSNVKDSSVRIVKGGSVVATEKANAGFWTTLLQYQMYGDETNLWGTTWTPADINDATFGAVLSAQCAIGDTANVDYARITVYYITGGYLDEEGVQHQRRTVW